VLRDLCVVCSVLCVGCGLFNVCACCLKPKPTTGRLCRYHLPIVSCIPSEHLQTFADWPHSHTESLFCVFQDFKFPSVSSDATMCRHGRSAAQEF